MMPPLRHLHIVAIAAFALVGSSASAQRVERIIDGDTIVVQGVGTVRLIGVDTPETVDPRRPVQYFGREASAFTRGVAAGKVVRLEFDVDRRDRYGRTLAYVYLPDGMFLNAEIVRQGYGHAYTQFPFKFLEQFRTYEREARQVGRGLWAGSRTSNPSSAQPVITASDRCIDVNRAPVGDLERIIHIGTERAEQMTGLRPFRSVSDLVRIDGIGPARLRDIVAEGLACVR